MRLPNIIRTAGRLFLLLVLVIVAMTLFSPALAHLDASRDARGKPPLFCWSHWVGEEISHSDGGTEDFEGFGYHFTHKHKIILMNYQAGDPIRHESGVRVRFYLPGYQRFDFETSPQTDPR